MATPLANSTNELRVTLTDRAGQPVLSATVTLTLNTPDGTAVLSGVTVPSIGGGVYEYEAAPAAFPVTGSYKATWNAVSAGKTWHKVESYVVGQ